MPLNGRILVVHTQYRQPGGEDRAFAQEVRLLRDLGLDVEVLVSDNRALTGRRLAELASVAVWNRDAYRSVQAAVRRHRSDLVHFHNTFPLLSPAVVHAAVAAGAAVVQTWHNYRLDCANALLFRQGHPCQDCVGKRLGWPGVVHACYHGNRSASLGVVAMQAAHRALGTYTRAVDRHVALTPFARDMLVRMGLPPERIAIKPNFTPRPAADLPEVAPTEPYVLFVGRLTEDKGLRVALDAWTLRDPGLPLYVVGSGPLEAEARALAARHPNVRMFGALDFPRVLDLMRGAHALLLPSIWYETLPLTLLEAYSVGLPVIGSRLGATADLVKDGRTGLLFRPDDTEDLARALHRSLDDPSAWAAMRDGARREYEAHYTPEANGARLVQIYREALEQRWSRP